MIEWLKDDSDRLQQYLQKSDYKLLKKLKEFIPKVSGDTLEKSALEGRGKQEAENMLDRLEELSSMTRDPESRQMNVDTTVGL